MKQRYRDLMPRIREAGWLCGYAIAIHGTKQRDLDLIAVPWLDGADPSLDLVEAVRVAVKGEILSRPATKPHGRIAWTIHLGPDLYLDLSVMPRWQTIRI